MTTPHINHRYNNSNVIQQQLHSTTLEKSSQDSTTNLNISAISGSGKQHHGSSLVDNNRTSAAAVALSSLSQQVDEIEENHTNNTKEIEADLNIFVKQLL